MTNYYIEKDNKIILVNTDLESLKRTLIHGIDNNIKIQETERPIVDFEFADTEEYMSKMLSKSKVEKLVENENKRNTKLQSGVSYKNIIFDSDTDQKSNLMYAIAAMDDIETMTWYGMNNDPLVCKKSDLLAIGQLIQELTTYVWGNLNPQYTQAINNAKSIDELNAINIQY